MLGVNIAILIVLFVYFCILDEGIGKIQYTG